MPQLLCPYCFDPIGGDGFAYRCLNANLARCEPMLDEALAGYQRLNKAVMMPRVFGPTKDRNPRCSCGSNAKPICPACHNDLPGEFGSLPAKTIALVGAKDVGKSNYIAVLIQQLTNRVGAQFGASLNALDDRTRTRYAKDFQRYIYKERQAVPTTHSARTYIDGRYPLNYRFSLERRRFLFGSDLRVNALTFFDTAGEDLKNIDLVSTEAKYLSGAHGIIVLLDPLQILAVRERLQGVLELPPIEDDPVFVIERITQVIRSNTGHGPGKLPVPVALAFSKIDAVRTLIDPGSPIHRASNHDGFFDLTDSDRVNDSMRAYVREWIGPLHSSVATNFETYSYFGVSALGSSPEKDGHLPTGAAPFRVEDPFLWLLHRFGIIPGKRIVS